MNFLAHAYLSGDESDIRIGNFIGDFVKGKSHESFPPNIQRGVLLHRAIDEFTDNHAVVAESKNRLRGKYRHYSGVIVDVIYDHLLAANWQDYHHQTLLSFTEGLFADIERRRDILPERFKNMFFYMRRDNWLYHYAKIEGINRALSGMARRTKFDSKMEEAVEDLNIYYSEFNDEFQEFLPALESFVKDWLVGLSRSKRE